MSHPEDAAGDKYLFQDTMRDDASICVGSGSERGAGSGERGAGIGNTSSLNYWIYNPLLSDAP